MKLNTEYKKRYDKLAYGVLSEKSLRSKLDVCLALKCTLDVLDDWILKNASFRNAIELGLIASKQKFLTSLAKLAVRPQKNVNTAMLLYLANEIYASDTQKIKTDQNVDEIVDIEDLQNVLRERGIPLISEGMPDI